MAKLMPSPNLGESLFSATCWERLQDPKKIKQEPRQLHDGGVSSVGVGCWMHHFDCDDCRPPISHVWGYHRLNRETLTMRRCLITFVAQLLLSELSLL